MPVLLQTVISLGIALLIVPLAKHIYLPTIVGFFIAGFIVPSLPLDLTEFATASLMFILGLKIRLTEIKLPPLPELLKTTLLTLFITLATWILLNQNIALSFIIGGAFSLNSWCLKQDHRPIIFIFQSILLITILTLIPVISDAQPIHHGIALVAIIIASLSGCLILNHFFIRPLCKNLIPELTTAFGIFWALFIILFTTAFGLHITIGAFFAGIILTETPFFTHFDQIITPFKTILSGLFFAIMGMSISLSISSIPLILIGVILLIGCKILMSIGINYYQKQPISKDFTLAQSGEFTIIILLAAQAEHLITAELTQSLTIIAILSLAINPIVDWIFKRKQNAIIPTQLCVIGFDRIGQILARIAYFENTPFSIIDQHMQSADLIHQYGGLLYADPLNKIDFTQTNTVVLAIEDIQLSLKIAKFLTKHHSQLDVCAWAYDHHHAYLLKQLGIKQIWQDTHGTTLDIAAHIFNQNDGFSLFKKYDDLLINTQKTSQNLFKSDQRFKKMHQEHQVNKTPCDL